MKRNLLALVMVAIVCALAAQFLRQGGQNKDWTALRVDMVDALERFWNTRGHQVELLPHDKGVNVSAQVVLPQDCNARQQQWNYPLLRYVAQRNATPVLHGLSLTTSQGLLPEMASPGEAQGAMRRPYSSGGSSETHLELVRRQAQAWLDGLVGPGNGLALVDGDSRQVPQPLPRRSENHYIRPRQEVEGRRAPASESARAVSQPIVLTEYTTVLVLVINGRAEGAEAKLSRLPELEQSLQLQLDGRDSRRVVVLP